MNLIWVLLPVAVCLASLLLSAVQAGAFAGGRLARSWAVKAAPRATAVSLLILFLAPKPPPVAAAVLGYAGFALIGLGWSLRGRLSAAVQAAGFLAVIGSQGWIQWVQEGRQAVLHTAAITAGMVGLTVGIFVLAAWYERREAARMGEGA